MAPGAPSKPRTFAVRFESYDDFLVAYTDHLRKGELSLPLPQEVATGAPLRLKVFLPDGNVLYLTGRVQARGDAASANCRVRVDDMGPEQRARLEACLHGAPDLSGVPANETAPTRLDVLLVDDSVSVRLAIGDVLRSQGMRVRVAEHGLEGLSMALKRAPQVLLTDLEMPVMDGWKLLQMVRARPRLSHVPVVFLTRLSDEASRLKGYRLGVDDYLPKDTPPDELVARLLAVAGRRWRARERGAGQGLRGDLAQVGLGSLLAFLEAEGRSGALHLEHPEGDAAILHMTRGRLARVENLGSFTSVEDRVFELLDWSAGTFEFTAGEGGPAPDEARAVRYLLLEHARRQDELGQG